MTVGVATPEQALGGRPAVPAALPASPGPAAALRRRLLSGSFPRFCLVGASNTLLSFSVFRLGLLLFAPLWGTAAAAQAVAYGAGIVWSYAWNSRWTFRHRGALVPTFSAFAGAQLFMLALSAGLVGLAIDGLALPATASWVGVTAAVTVLNYLTLKKLVFRR